MIIGFETDIHKSTLLIGSYVKAQKIINHYSRNVQDPYRKFIIDMTTEITFIDYVPAILVRLYDSINRDEPIPEELSDFLEPIFYNVQENMYIDSIHVFHFGFFFNNRDLLEHEEEEYFFNRMQDMCKEFSSPAFMSLSHFYNYYYRSNFIQVDHQPYQDNEDLIDHTFLLFADYNNHSIETFGPSFMNQATLFTRAYSEFYDDLTSALDKQKGAVTHAQLSFS